MSDFQSVKDSFNEYRKIVEQFKDNTDSSLKELQEGKANDNVSRESVAILDTAVKDVKDKVQTISKMINRNAVFRDSTSVEKNHPLVSEFLKSCDKNGYKSEIYSTSANEYCSVFEKYLRKSVGRHGEGLDGSSAKVLNSGLVEGSYVLPVAMTNCVYSYLDKLNPFRSRASVNIVCSNRFVLPVASNKAQATWISDDTSISSSYCEVKEKVLKVNTINLGFKMRNNVIEDTEVPLEQWLEWFVATQFSLAEAKSFIVGTGDNSPMGILNISHVLDSDATRDPGKLQYVSFNSSEGINIEAFYKVISEINSVHRSNAVWLANHNTTAEMRKLKDSDNNYYWQSGKNCNNADTFLGYPVVEVEYIPNIGSDAVSIIFGNLKGYQIILKLPSVLRDPYSEKPATVLNVSQGVGGDVADYDAIKLLKHPRSQ